MFFRNGKPRDFPLSLLQFFLPGEIPGTRAYMTALQECAVPFHWNSSCYIDCGVACGVPLHNRMVAGIRCGIRSVVL